MMIIINGHHRIGYHIGGSFCQHFKGNDGAGSKVIDQVNNCVAGIDDVQQGRTVFMVAGQTEPGDQCHGSHGDHAKACDHIDALHIGEDHIHKLCGIAVAVVRAGQKLDGIYNIENGSCEQAEVDQELKPAHLGLGLQRSSRCYLLGFGCAFGYRSATVQAETIAFFYRISAFRTKHRDSPFGFK